MNHSGPDAEAEATHWRDLQASLTANGQRRLVLIEGDREDALQWLRQRLPGLDFDQGLWTGPKADSPDGRLVPMAPTRARSWLGRELPLVVWDGWQGNPPDDLAALTGALTAGGLLFWLMPPLSDWRRFADPDYARTGLEHGGEHPFAGRMSALLADHEAVIRVSPGRASLPLIPPLPDVPFVVSTTSDQQQLIQRLVRFGLGRRRRPLVITADRGRGKSAAMGMAAAELLLKGRQDIVVTAPSAQSTDTLFRHASVVLADVLTESSDEGWSNARGDEQLGTPGDEKCLVTRSGARLRFMPIRSLLASKPGAEVILVDEAAALPAPLLKAVLLGWPRVAFATTVHGYEGAGRGFAIRFRQVLDEKTPQWQAGTLTAPVRWAPNDPLEALVSELFLLAAAGDVGLPQPEGAEAPVIEPFQPAHASDRVLAEAFGLLVDAHYRTSPADLRQWLDDPRARSWRATLNGRTVGVLWSTEEGGLSPELAGEVSLGTRRVRGHLLAQSLASHSGYPEAAALKGLRVVRVAVADEFRRLGIGRRLVDAARVAATESGIDYLGTSFGGSVDLVAFWQGCGLGVARMGLQQEASSGEYPIQMMRGLSSTGLELAERIRKRLASHWLALLPDNWPELAPELLAQVTADLPGGPAPDAEDLRDLRQFAHGHRGFALTVPVLRKLGQAPGVMAWLAQHPSLGLWCLGVMQGRPWSWLQAEALCLGQRDGEDRLRQLVRDLLENGLEL